KNLLQFVIWNTSVFRAHQRDYLLPDLRADLVGWRPSHVSVSKLRRAELSRPRPYSIDLSHTSPKPCRGFLDADFSLGQRGQHVPAQLRTGPLRTWPVDVSHTRSQTDAFAWLIDLTKSLVTAEGFSNTATVRNHKKRPPGNLQTSRRGS